MFRQPEEWIMAILAVLWCVAVYFAVPYTGAAAQTVLLTTAANAVWTVVAFWVWQRNRFYPAAPWLAGLWTLCSWFVLHDFAVRHNAENAANVWYVSPIFKLILAVAAVVVAYGYRWRKLRRNKKREF